MPFDPSQGPLVLAVNNANYPNARVLQGTAGALNVVDGGAGSTLSIAPLGNLLGLSNLNASGLVSYSPSAKQFFGNRIVSSDGSINITNPGGGAGGINLSVVDGTSNQNVTVKSGAQSATTSTINLSSANSNMTIAVTQDSVNNESDVVFTVTGGGGSSGLTSVGLGEVSGGTNFNFTNNPLTSNGTIVLDIAVGGLPLSRIAQAGATTGQILSWSGSAWAPASATSSTIAVIAPGLSSTAVGGVTFTGSGVTGSAAGGVATINIPGGGGSSGLTSVGLTSTGATATITGSPLTSNGNINIEIPNWSTVLATGNPAIPFGNFFNFGDIAIRQVENVDYLQTYTGSNGSGAIYDSLFNPLGGFGGTPGQVLSLVTAAVYGTPGTPQVLQWVDNGGGGGGAVSSVSATGGTSVITPTTGAVVLQMDLPLHYANTNFSIGANNSSLGDYNFFVNGIGAPSSGTSAATSNTAFGFQALFDLSTGSNNTAFGQSALDSITTGVHNTAVGSNAMVSITSGSDNTAIGYSAGPNAGIVVSQCTFVGSSSETATSSIQNSIAIGYNSVVNASNAAVLGNPTQDMTLGIGTDTPCPAGQLHLSQKNSASPSAIIMDAIPLATTAALSVPAGALCIANMQTNNTSVPLPVVAKGPSGIYAGIPLFEISSLSEGSYPPGSILYSAVSDGTEDNLLFFTSCPEGTKSSFGIDFTGPTPTPVWTPIAASSLAQSFVALGTPESPTPPEQNISYIATESVVTEPTEFTLPLDLPLGSSFRVIGNNPYGWIITSQLGQETNQRICWGANFILATSSQIAFIQTVGTQFPYLNDCVELVYTLTENDGTQVWTVVNSEGNLDMGTI
jgi:hypothetical protein